MPAARGEESDRTQRFGAGRDRRPRLFSVTSGRPEASPGELRRLASPSWANPVVTKQRAYAWRSTPRRIRYMIGEGPAGARGDQAESAAVLDSECRPMDHHDSFVGFFRHIPFGLIWVIVWALSRSVSDSRTNSAMPDHRVDVQRDRPELETASQLISIPAIQHSYPYPVAAKPPPVGSRIGRLETPGQIGTGEVRACAPDRPALACDR